MDGIKRNDKNMNNTVDTRLIKNFFSEELFEKIKQQVLAKNLGPQGPHFYHTVAGRWLEEIHFDDETEKEILDIAIKVFGDSTIRRAGFHTGRYQIQQGIKPQLWKHWDQSACQYSLDVCIEKTVDWKSREKELMDICNKYRSKNGTFDCVVPSSGGKDSAWVAHELKTKFKMHPLTVTWSPLKYTDIGWENLQNFNDNGFDIIMGIAKGDVRKRLCRDAMIEMGDPFQPFIYGQYLFPM